MQDVKKSFSHDGVDYPLVFNLNVMERVQQEYGSVELWGDYTDGTFNGRKEYEKKNGAGSWDELEIDERAKFKGEPDAKSIIFGFTEMINEGLDIENEENALKGISPRPMMSLKQVGRLVTAIGLETATQKLSETVIESQKIDNDEIKNV